MKQHKAEKLHYPDKESASYRPHNDVVFTEIVRGKQKGQSQCYRNANRNGANIGERGKAHCIPVPQACGAELIKNRATHESNAANNHSGDIGLFPNFVQAMIDVDNHRDGNHPS